VRFTLDAAERARRADVARVLRALLAREPETPWAGTVRLPRSRAARWLAALCERLGARRAETPVAPDPDPEVVP